MAAKKKKKLEKKAARKVAARKPPKAARTKALKAKDGRKAKPPAKSSKKAKSDYAGPPPEMQMLQYATGYWVSQMVFVATKLGVADLLAKGPQTAEALANEVGANPAYLHRLLRALASVGVFAEDGKARFRLTPLAATLRSDVKGSLRDFVLMIVDDYNREAWGALELSVREGRTAFDAVFNKPCFEYLREHPEKDRQFAASMASISRGHMDAVAEAYPFGELSTLVDVGGGYGHLLAAILRKHKSVKGILYDQPQVVEGAGASGFISDPKLAKRITVQGGDFFESVPEGADGYLMKSIIHDWDDALSLRILENCRDAMAKKGRVLLAESVIPKGNDPHFGKLLDINMMALPGGQERTKDEYAALFAKAGLKLKRIIQTASPMNVIEAVKA